jgi:putative phosphoribosyl transferase
MTFASREDAGRRLGQYLCEQGVVVDRILGLPRGGVVVAAEVARVLQRPLEVIVVRKVGHPWHREFAVGALAEGGVAILDHEVVGRNELIQAQLERVLEEERERLHEYELKFHALPRQSFENQHVLLVDDGLATGATIEAAAVSARRQRARGVTVAVPVASIQAVERVQRVADVVIALLVDPDFDAVGRYYRVFQQTSDEEVLALLKAVRDPV